MTIQKAMEVFGTALATVRSFTYPCEYAQLGQLSVTRDTPFRMKGGRVEEFFGVDLPAKNAVAELRAYEPRRFYLCSVVPAGESTMESKDDFKSFGFRLLRTEAFMVRDLGLPIEEVPGLGRVERVEAMEVADKWARAAGSRQILPEHLGSDDAPIRGYLVADEGKPVGWVRSVRSAGEMYVSNMYVLPEYRRKGIARALMTRLLLDDRRLGASHSVLLASLSGSKLYPLLGYEQIGTLLLLGPPKDWSTRGDPSQQSTRSV